ncbi:MAG: hypothetical protein QMD12_02400 [Candidatus Aenigmarchaeota archaeon]|nr:hypothetical protein [Candidatus Aenigmarchaeota archaeon]
MTLRYKLFGVPGNLTEFLDKVRKTGDRSVDINPYATISCDGTARSYCVRLLSKLRSKERGTKVDVLLAHVMTKLYDLEDYAKRELSRLANKLSTYLQKQGLSTTLNEIRIKWRSILRDTGRHTPDEEVREKILASI